MFQFSSDLTVTPLAQRHKSAEPLAAVHTAGHLDGRRAGAQATLNSLVIPFAVVVLDVLGHCPGPGAHRSESADPDIFP